MQNNILWRSKMRIFHFSSDIYHFIIYSSSFSNALTQFTQTLTSIYGSTLQGWKSGSEINSLTVCWRKEGETEMREDTFRLSIWPENTSIQFNCNGGAN